MKKLRLSRRELLLATTTLGVARALGGAGSAMAGETATQAPATPLTSKDGVFLPPRGAALQKFSFAVPEPSVDFAGLQFGFSACTFENTYAIDPALTSTESNGDRMTVTCSGFTWAGGQERAPGALRADLVRTGDGSIEWHVSARMERAIKSVTTIVRGLPRGELSSSIETFQDIGDSERTFEYPALTGGMATPLVLIKRPDGHYLAVSALQNQVRPVRFAFQPGPDSYRVAMTYEREGWSRSNEIRSNRWRIAAGRNLNELADSHLEHVQKAYAIPDLDQRRDVPSWMRRVGLVVALHGMHWSGYIFNDYARQLAILRWIATKVDPKYVMVFLPAWDGRYYWNYPLYEADSRMGGAAKFRELIDEGHRLGFHFAAMFGANTANRQWPIFESIADAEVRRLDGNAWYVDWVDWDGDQRNEAWLSMMNLGVASWRNYLRDRIAATTKQYQFDAYFLDIAGTWENNMQGDMFEGTQTLVSELARLIPGVPPIAEMQYDALMAIMPMSQVPRFSAMPEANYRYVASFQHLSHGAPGTGSTGVHEYGFTTYRPVVPDQLPIPTITFVDDTFDKHRSLVEEDIAMAKDRMKRLELVG